MMPKLHLPVEHLGAMTVAVDGDGRAGGDGAAREGAIEIQMRRRAVDLDDGSGFDGSLEQPVVVELVAAADTGMRRLVGCVMIDDQRVPHRA